MSKLHLTSTHLLCAAMALLPMGSIAMAQDAVDKPAVQSRAYELGREDKTLTATVVSIDKSTRSITLRGPAGKEVTVKAGPEVQNFDQLSTGDQVTAHYQAALALELLPADSAKLGSDSEGESSTAMAGAKPGGEASDSVTVTARLAAIDLANHTVTLEGADGHQRVIEVKDPARQAKMSKLKVGEMVRITYVEALAVQVSPKAN